MKENIKLITFYCLMHLPSPVINAQDVKNVNASRSNSEKFGSIPDFRIGDSVPNLYLKKVFNAKNHAARISDFNSQLLILDFWFINCSSCISGMPKLESLQKHFSNKIKILLVNPADTEDQVEHFWKTNRVAKNISLPSVVEDSTLVSYFNCIRLPHNVWVYKGIVIGITDPEYVDSYNIEKILSGQRLNFPVKNDFYRYDISRYPLHDRNGAVNNYCKVFPYKEVNGVSIASQSAGIKIIRNTKSKTVRAYILNKSIYNAYLCVPVAYNNLNIPPGARWKQSLWEVSNKGKYDFSSSDTSTGRYYGDYLRKNGICFESQYTDTGQTDKQVYSAVKRDLDSLLGLRVGWEKRKEKVFVIVKMDIRNRLLKGETSSEKNTIDINSVVQKMNENPVNPYVFNETGYKDSDGVMKLAIADWSDVPSIRKAISPYGLDIKEDERLVDRFVFREKNFPTATN